MVIYRQLVVISLCLISQFAMADAPKKPFPIPTIDLNDQVDRQVVVDREVGQYLGHVTTCLLEDGKTMLCVYPKGHGRGAIVYKRSTDGGLTWSDRLPTPASWATSKEVPTLHRVVGPDGKKRIIMWSGLYPARLAVTEDDGLNWSELKPVGDWGGIVVMGFVESLKTGKGHYMAMFHDDGRFFRGRAGVASGKRTDTMTLYKTFSKDGGLTWSFPETVYHSSEVHLCEPGCIRSPDGKRLAVLLRENARRKNSHVIFSDDEGKMWSEPRELPLALTGDRHTGKYGPDGRLFISFRCRSPKHRAKGRPFEGDWVGWVGTWDDIVGGRDGQYSVRLKENTKGYDTTYPGVEILPDGTFVTTTYGHWDQGEPPYILSVRFTLDELDVLAKQPTPIPVFVLGDGTKSRYGGATWTPLVDERQLIEPQCMGSILRADLPGRDSQPVLVFSCPGSKKGRKNGTIYASFDDGKSWPVYRVLEPGGFAYSQPPPVELYDLKNDPCEWNNRADDPKMAVIRQRLETALHDWQSRMKDPLADEVLLQRFTRDEDAALKMNYRRDKTYRWPYLDYFQESIWQ